jgi:hypothetical protein
MTTLSDIKSKYGSRPFKNNNSNKLFQHILLQKKTNGTTSTINLS